MRTFEEIRKELREPIPVHFHAGDREPHLTPLALHDLETLHSSALALIQQQEITVLGVKAALATVKKQLAQFEWISVEDRLPEYWTPVMVYLRHIPDDGYRNIRIIMRSEEFGWARLEKHFEITHWMPLPEPPKEDYDE